MCKIVSFAYILPNMEELNTYISNTDYSGIKSFFLERGKKQVFQRKEYFVQQNAVSLYAGYIEKGIFHYSRTDCSGKEHIVGFSFENEFICDYSSFIKRTESLVNICALTECTVYLISLSDSLEYANTIQNGSHFGFRVANELFDMYYKRLLALYCESPEQRYISLMQPCPDLKEKIPLKQIASFIGVSPETISHIRKKLLFD